MFKVTIITAASVLYEAQAWSVFLPGSTGEFEVMELHKPIVSLLKKGKIVIDWNKEVFIKRGAVRMSGDDLVAVVEQ